MVITNEAGLPQALVDFAKRDVHIGEEYSASQLTKSPRQFWIEKRHSEEIVKDVSDMVWLLFGSAVHAIIEKAQHENQFIEEYFVETVNGIKLSGRTDVYDNGVIQDWKTTSVWSYIYLDEQKLFNFESQLNTYAYFFRKAGFPVNGLEIIMLFRDWKKTEALKSPDYPQKQAQKLPIKLWPEEETYQYLDETLHDLDSYRNIPDDKLPLCTREYRWAKPPKFAVMKKGAKRAKAVLDTRDEAVSKMEELGPDHFIEERPGECWKRCEYCDAREFCNQYKNQAEDESQLLLF